MPHSYNSHWAHIVWATKYRAPLIRPDIEKDIHRFMYDQFRKMGCVVKIINGMPDHVHCLVRINPNKSISEIVKQVKGSTSFFVNEHQLAQGKFAWQRGFYSNSVSESIVETVSRYISNQKQHHLNLTLNKEYLRIFKTTLPSNQ